ncbi:MAG: hypothetical protein FJ098_10430 [Deltaproteobacteria bacterium]|nr:hypothetical protein [Deltaproteobacteria bacterium]
MGFALRAEEAQFLRDRLVETHPECLLAHLVLHCEPADVAFPWQHPDWAGFTPDHRELMEHARLFSEVMHGAALLYNLALAEQAGRTELADEHREALGRWGEATDRAAVRGWSLDRLWVLTTAPGVTISQPTRRFVETWVAQVRAKPGSLADGDDARDLIRRRERALKGAHSRFSNQRALDQWSGYSGTGRLVYRWPTAKTFHQDLHAGFRRT